MMTRKTLFMRMFQILGCILIFGFACNLVACDSRWDVNSNTPKPTREYTRDFGEKTIDNLRSFEDGFVCSVDARELLVVDRNGNDRGTYEFSYDIKSIYTEDESTIMVLLENNEVVSLIFEDGDFGIEYDIEFNDSVDSISFWYDSYFVLFEDGALYAFGENRNSFIDSDAAPEEIIDTPCNIAENVKCVAGHFAVLRDNSVLELLSGDISDSFDEEILGIYESHSIFLVTEHSLYTLNNDLNFAVYAEIDTRNADFSPSSCVYVHDNRIFYSGQLSETSKGKGVSWAENYDLGMEAVDNMCAVRFGFCVWNSHSVEYYSV